MTIRRRALLLGGLPLLLALVACAPSPTTTYTDASGAEVTVDWEDYPGSEGTIAEDVLSGPREADVESIEAALVSAVQARLSAEFSLEWTDTREAGWFDQRGNGYGGISRYITYNSRDHVSLGIPASTADWERVVAIVSEQTRAFGLGDVVLDHVRDATASDREWRAEQYGTDDPDEYWVWTGSAVGGSHWLAVSLVDVERDPSGRAAEEYDEFDWQPQSISLSYGATVVPDDERAAFERELAPFRGLAQPPGTSSD